MTLSSAGNDLNAYRDGVGLHFGQQMLQRFDAACLTAASAINDLDEQSGYLIAAAMCDAAPQQSFDCLSAMQLASVELRFGDASTRMAPHEAHAHPLLAAWTRDTLPAAMADALRAGRLLTALAPGAPVFDWFHLYHAEGERLFAASQLTFAVDRGQAVATFNFGAQPSSGFVRASIASGTAVFLVGAHVRQSGGLSGSNELADAEGEPGCPPAEGITTLFGQRTVH